MKKVGEIIVPVFYSCILLFITISKSNSAKLKVINHWVQCASLSEDSFPFRESVFTVCFSTASVDGKLILGDH